MKSEEYKKNAEKLRWLKNVPELIRTPLDKRVIKSLEERQKEIDKILCQKNL